ncbi:hypothetical protein LINPERHAP2_LOCUS41511 [Linum perenne]
MVDLSSRGKVLVCLTMSLVLLIAFSSKTLMAQRVVYLPIPSVKEEELGTEISHEGIFRESKLGATGSSSGTSRHGNNRRGKGGGHTH